MNGQLIDILATDTTVTAQINSFSGHIPALDLAVSWLSGAGPYVMVGLIVTKWWAGKETRDVQRHLAIRSGLATSLGIVLNQLILLFVHRGRPYDSGITHLIIAPSSDPSFPSDHATVAFAIAVTLLLQRDKWWSSFLLLAILVSISRVYIGTHFISDVVGGALIGVFAAGVIAKYYPPSHKFFKRLVRIA